jgi:hypothetical protein
MTATIRANRHPGRCADCGHPVAAEAGRLDGSRDAGWTVRHLDGQCDTSPPPAPAAPAPRKNLWPGDCTECGERIPANAGQAVRDPAVGWVVRHIGDCPEPPAPLPDVPEGRYAVDNPARPGELTFWKIGHPTSGPSAGRVYIKQIVGGHADEKLYGDEARAALEAILAAGVQAARDRYADETRTCWRCGIELTEGLSRQIRTGPDCCMAEWGMTQAQRLAVITAA